ncbi:DUF6183 family protein [Streptomyces sp. NPDC058812]|uniref:DUF6183 family protein n=1 Tax=unclassified Streptomyces TaxID=2593676 RepID=UPI003693B875
MSLCSGVAGRNPKSGVELRACLLGELTLIGSEADRRSLDAYAERLRELGHPLARLPRTRLEIEHRFMVRVRGLGSIKTSKQLRSRFPEIPSTSIGAVAGRTAGETRDGGRAKRLLGRSRPVDGSVRLRHRSSRCRVRSVRTTSVTAGVPLLEAVRRAVEHRWLRFMAFTDWFRHDTSDVAFAVLDPSRTRVAVLAATDTDVDRDVFG